MTALHNKGLELTAYSDRSCLAPTSSSSSGLAFGPNPLFGDHMSKVALFIKHKTLPGKRDEVRKVWMRHMQPNITSNPAHEAYFYCFDNNDPDSICAFQ